MDRYESKVWLLLVSIYYTVVISLSTKQKLKTISKAVIAVYTEIASKSFTDVWSTSKFIKGNIAQDHCDFIR